MDDDRSVGGGGGRGGGFYTSSLIFQGKLNLLRCVALPTNSFHQEMKPNDDSDDSLVGFILPWQFFFFISFLLL